MAKNFQVYFQRFVNSVNYVIRMQKNGMLLMIIVSELRVKGFVLSKRLIQGVLTTLKRSS